MPALPDVPHVIKVEITGVISGAQFANIFHVLTVSDPSNVTDLASYLTYLNSTALPALLNNRSTGLTVSEVKGTCLTTTSSPATSITGTAHGTLVGTDLPGSTVGLIHWPISRRYRGGHPRTYLGGVVQAQMATNIALTNTAQTQFAADAANFRNDVNAHTESWSGTMTLVAVSYFTGHALRATPVVDSLGAPRIQPRLCTQRRRLGKEFL